MKKTKFQTITLVLFVLWFVSASLVSGAIHQHMTTEEEFDSEDPNIETAERKFNFDVSSAKGLHKFWVGYYERESDYDYSSDRFGDRKTFAGLWFFANLIVAVLCFLVAGATASVLDDPKRVNPAVFIIWMILAMFPIAVVASKAEFLFWLSSK